MMRIAQVALDLRFSLLNLLEAQPRIVEQMQHYLGFRNTTESVQRHDAGPKRIRAKSFSILLEAGVFSHRLYPVRHGAVHPMRTEMNGADEKLIALGVPGTEWRDQGNIRAILLAPVRRWKFDHSTLGIPVKQAARSISICGWAVCQKLTNFSYKSSIETVRRGCAGGHRVSCGC